MSAVSAPSRPQQNPLEFEFDVEKGDLLTPQQKEIAHAIIQIAVRIFVVFSLIMMAGALLPIAFHAVLIPAIAIGAAFLACFLFQYDSSAFTKEVVSLPSILKHFNDRAILFNAPMPPAIPPAAQRGLYRQGQNCSLNSIIQILERCPRLAAWFRNPPPVDLEPFIQFLAPYELRPEMIQAFRDYVAGLNPVPPIPQAFALFLDGYAPAAEHRGEFTNFRITYKDLIKLQPFMSQFFAAYDAARAQNLGVVNANTQFLRLALNQVSAAIDASANVQLDASEVLSQILGVLPKSELMRLEKSTHYNVHGVAPIADHPDGITRKEETLALLPLEMDPEEPRANMLRLINHFCDEALNIPNEREWIDQRNVFNEVRKYQPTRRHFEFIEPPPFLMIQLKRYKQVPPPESWLSKVLPRWWPGMQWRYMKINTPVDIPERFELHTQNGMRVYNLTAVDKHEGATPNSGHYLTYTTEVENGEKVYYCLDDTKVTRISREAWLRAVESSYLIQYLPE